MLIFVDLGRPGGMRRPPGGGKGGGGDFCRPSIAGNKCRISKTGSFRRANEDLSGTRRAMQAWGGGSNRSAHSAGPGRGLVVS